MPYPIIRFDRLARQLVANQNTGLDYVRVAILMEIAARTNEGRSTSISDLVKCWRFGTVPTVHSHLDGLIELQLILKATSATDRRKAELKLSNAGDALLESFSKLMTIALG